MINPDSLSDRPERYWTHVLYGPPTILVVDDDVSIRTIVCAMLEPAGYEPVLASSAEEAIAQLDDGLKPRLILSDIVMTGMTGLALLDHVRERHAEIRS